MKNLIALFALMALSFGLVSCKKEQPVYNVTECNCYYNSVLINVNTENWEYSKIDNNNFFHASCNMPEITSDVFKNGVIKMYRVYNFNTPDAFQTEMPFTRQFEEYVDDKWVFYTENMYYDISVGRVDIYYTLSDFYYEDKSMSLESMQFRCVIAHN